MATFKVSSVSKVRISTQLTGMQTVNYTRLFEFYIDDVLDGSRSLSGSTTSTTWTYGDEDYGPLEPGTTYSLKVIVYKEEEGREIAKFTTRGTTKSNVEPWTWDDCQTIGGDVGEAADIETMSAYSAITKQMETTEFSYKVWNDLCAKTREVRTARGSSSWRSDFLSYSDTLMSSSDKILTAERFNSLRINIGSMQDVSSIPYPVVKGGEVYGSYFTTLTNALNDEIANL